MSEVDPSIILQARPNVQLENPMDVQAKALQLRQLGIQTQAAQRDYQNQQTLADLYRNNIGADGSVDHNAIMNGMAKSGLGAQIPAYQKSLLDVTKTKADIGETQAKTGQANATTAKTQLETTLQNVQNVGSHLYSLAQDPNLNHDSAFAAINSWANQGIIDPQQGASIARSLPGDPQALKSYMLQKATEGLGIEQQIKAKLDSLPKPAYEDVGPQKVPVDMNPLTNGGKLPTLNKSMTPDEAAKLQFMKSGALTDDTKRFLAERIVNGERPAVVLGNLGRGQQGAADLRDVQNLIPQVAAAKGVSATQMANIMQNTQADARTLTELGAREGRIAPRVQEAQNFAQVAKDASAQVPRGSFVPWNKLSQMADTSMSDPKLAKLKAATNSLVNAYAAAVGGGTPTVHDKEAADHMLSTAQSPEAYNAVVDQLILETQKALDAPGQVRARINSSVGGQAAPGARPPLSAFGSAK